MTAYKHQKLGVTTQSNHPLRAVVRTIIALCAALPTLLLDSGLNHYAAVAQVAAVAGAVTGLLANPNVEMLLSLSPLTSWITAAPHD